MFKRILRKVFTSRYQVAITAVWPLNRVLVFLLKDRTYPNSVLHISYMVHVPYYTTRILRSIGIKADYLANITSPTWNKSDFQSPNSQYPMIQALREFVFFWKVVAKYQVLHLHFGHTMSRGQWELPFLKKLGRKIVIHYRGCEIRDYNKNIHLHPDVNICQNCDYNYYCISEANQRRIRFLTSYGDKILVTTPDLKDFIPTAKHVPFFLPEKLPQLIENGSEHFPQGALRILHWTNHPGIEGSEQIEAAIRALQAKGYSIVYKFLRGVTHEQVMQEIPQADLTIGKLKMGYYANAQIESMACGVPAITWIRPEFMTKELQESGFIFSTLADIEQTLERILKNPDELKKKKAIARQSILKLHNNLKISEKYREIYFGIVHLANQTKY